jgi:hypothetical protein
VKKPKQWQRHPLSIGSRAILCAVAQSGRGAVAVASKQTLLARTMSVQALHREEKQRFHAAPSVPPHQ